MKVRVEGEFKIFDLSNLVDGDNDLLRWRKPLDMLYWIAQEIRGGSLGKSKAEGINFGVFSIKRFMGLDEIPRDGMKIERIRMLRSQSRVIYF